MKKIILALALTLVFTSTVMAEESENIALLTKKGFFEKQEASCLSSPLEDIKKTFALHFKYSNGYDFEGLKSLYADSYVNADGLNKDIYFELIKKTWAAYPDIKYKLDIKNVEINGDFAVIQVAETANATTSSASAVVNEKGTLVSLSDSIYYLQKINNRWLVVSDKIVFEKTSLRYGEANALDVGLYAPCQIAEDTQFTATLKIKAPDDCLVIASIGQEGITYPQVNAEEVFRKLPENGILERVFKANNKKINEYVSASFGITKAQIKDGKEIKVYVTGLGFVMTRVNVVPKNQYIKESKAEKVEENENTKSKKDGDEKVENEKTE